MGIGEELEFEEQDIAQKKPNEVGSGFQDQKTVAAKNSSIEPINAIKPKFTLQTERNTNAEISTERRGDKLANKGHEAAIQEMKLTLLRRDNAEDCVRGYAVHIDNNYVKSERSDIEEEIDQLQLPNNISDDDYYISSYTEGEFYSRELDEECVGNSRRNIIYQGDQISHRNPFKNLDNNELIEFDLASLNIESGRSFDQEANKGYEKVERRQINSGRTFKRLIMGLSSNQDSVLLSGRRKSKDSFGPKDSSRAHYTKKGIMKKQTLAGRKHYDLNSKQMSFSKLNDASDQRSKFQSRSELDADGNLKKMKITKDINM